MITIVGKYGVAEVFTDVLEESAQEQILNLCRQPFSKGSKIRVMPDVHGGKGCVIGLTMTVSSVVCPNLVGVDIGCGVTAVKLDAQKADMKKLDWIVRHKIPAGYKIRQSPHRLASGKCLEELHCRESADIERALLSVGTLGGGNHFIELDRDDKGALWLMVHSGSRHLGVEVAGHYQEAGYRQRVSEMKATKELAILNLKRDGKERDILSKLAEIEETMAFSKPLAWASGAVMGKYLHDMEIVQDFAKLNRAAIVHDIAAEMNWRILEKVETVHNYIDLKSMILRKGAVSAQKGEELIIPLNMRDGALLCRGKGNLEWNCSAPHGAGRRMSRKTARETLSTEEFQQQMKEVYSTSVGAGTLDESPMAYKPSEEIICQLAPTVEIVGRLKPVYSFKAEGR